MTDPGYLVIWLVAMAIATIFVLTVGTLAAADLRRREHAERSGHAEQEARRTEDPSGRTRQEAA